VLTCHLLDEGSNRLVNEVAFEFIPAGDQATRASLLQFEEGAQGAEDVIAKMARFQRTKNRSAWQACLRARW
jgi:hypothetical protein